MSRDTRSHRRARWVLGIALSSLVVGSFVWAPPASAATITVTTFEDEYGEGAACSLREASVAANTDEAFGGCSAGDGPDTISLSAGVYVLSIVGQCPEPPREESAGGFAQTCPDENVSRNGDIDFDDLDTDKSDDPGITVQGVGMNATFIDGNGGTVGERVFDVRNGDATFADLTVRHGNGLPFGQRGGGIFGHTNPDETLTILRSSVHANKATCRGGGVAAGSGTDLVVTDSEISNNEVERTECGEGEPFVPEADGGGIYASGPYAIQGSTISDNYAFQRGGGVYAPNGFYEGTITNSTISGNEVTGTEEESEQDQGAGGGLYIGAFNNFGRSSGEQESPVSIVDTTVANNHAFVGGGLFISCCGIIDVVESTFSNNRAFAGGGVFNESQSENSAYLTNVTVSSNYAFAGGGLYNAIGDMYLNHVTVYRNVAEEVGGGVYDESGFTLYYRNSIIAGNTYEDCGGTGQSQGYNFLGDGSCATDVPRGNGGGTDIFPVNGPIDPRLAPLRDNGGPTRTHELLPPTPEMPTPIDNAFTEEGCEVDTDQRGLIRPTGNGCDIGAYEVGSLEVDEDDDDGANVGGVVVDQPELCRKQNPTIVGTLGPDRIVGTSGPDIIQGLDARDVILGRGGDDIICGSLGDDVLKGQGGDDWTKGLRGDDTDRGGPGTDKCVRGPGEDKYFSCENVPSSK